MKFLGHVISGSEIAILPDRVRSLSSAPAPKSAKGVRSILGPVNNYRIFLPNFAHQVEPLVRSTRKGVHFSWGTEQRTAYEWIKKALSTSPILAQPDMDAPFYLTTAASTMALGDLAGPAGHESPGYYLSGSILQQTPDGHRDPVQRGGA